MCRLRNIQYCVYCVYVEGYVCVFNLHKTYCAMNIMVSFCLFQLHGPWHYTYTAIWKYIEIH